MGKESFRQKYFNRENFLLSIRARLKEKKMEILFWHKMEPIHQPILSFLDIRRSHFGRMLIETLNFYIFINNAFYILMNNA